MLVQSNCVTYMLDLSLLFALSVSVTYLVNYKSICSRVQVRLALTVLTPDSQSNVLNMYAIMVDTEPFEGAVCHDKLFFSVS